MTGLQYKVEKILRILFKQIRIKKIYLAGRVAGYELSLISSDSKRNFSIPNVTIYFLLSVSMGGKYPCRCFHGLSHVHKL